MFPNARHCSSCGVPLEGARCTLCSGSAEPLALLDGRGELPEVAIEGKPELEGAREAWTKGDHSRAIAQCLSVLGAEGVKNHTLPQGPAFVALVSGVSVTVRVDTSADSLTIETPVARLPQTQYVGAMRLALELSAGTRSPGQYAARAETLYLRMVGRLPAMTPQGVQSALRSMVSQAIDDAKVFSTSVRARAISAREHGDFDVEADANREGHQLELGSVRPPPDIEAEIEPKLPPLRDPKVTSVSPGARETALSRAETAKVPVLSATRDRDASDRPAALRPANIAAVLDTDGTPEEALCELLHKAQTLGALLSFADQPATSALLIRATVFRAVLGFDRTLPSVTSRLYSDAAPLTKEIYITAPGIRRGAMAIPSTTEAFESMRKIVDSRCVVESGPAVAVAPITSSQDAKQHLARYVSEIDQAPKDLEVRHFLALGALSELLVRAKLPAQTLERLRGIISHAERDGAKQPVVDLMMTALNRMMT